MYSDGTKEGLRKELAEIEAAGLTKRERPIESAQAPHIRVAGRDVINFCANNYLGLADNKDLVEAAKRALDEFGLGLASVRFICGTQTIHKRLESRISQFFGTEDTILYISCFDANGGLFETVLGEQDAVVSDSLNHASIIDGIRLSKARRFRFNHADMNHLRENLATARKEGCRRLLIATDGVFSMDGDVADLPTICKLAEEFDAMVMVDECHATGFFGPTGRGSLEHHGVLGKVDIVTSTLGKALGGSCGGFTTGRSEIVSLLRQRSRPYLFSNSIPPAVVGAALACLDLVESGASRLETLRTSTRYFRSKLADLGFDLKPGFHPIVPVMLGDAALAARMASDLLEEGVYCVGFSYPVVPLGQARIRLQVSAAHSRADLDTTVEAFAKVGRRHRVIA